MRPLVLAFVSLASMISIGVVGTPHKPIGACGVPDRRTQVAESVEGLINPFDVNTKGTLRLLKCTSYLLDEQGKLLEKWKQTSS